MNKLLSRASKTMQLVPVHLDLPLFAHQHVWFFLPRDRIVLEAYFCEGDMVVDDQKIEKTWDLSLNIQYLFSTVLFIFLWYKSALSKSHPLFKMWIWKKMKFV